MGLISETLSGNKIAHLQVWNEPLNGERNRKTKDVK